MTENYRAEMAERARAWMKANDGGNLCVWWPAGAKPSDPDDDSRPILGVLWDQGGVDELGTFYDKKQADDMRTITEIFNWALSELVPTERGYYGERTYLEDENDT